MNDTQYFHIHTLGCKVNQYESQLIREQLLANGLLEAANEQADISIINTCTVTRQSDSKSRRAIRKAAAAYPHAHIFITGCGVEKHKEYFDDMPQVCFIGGNEFKDRLSVLITTLTQTGSMPDVQSVVPETKVTGISEFEERTRAFVKAQDGCNSFCAYCTIPYVRGRSRSRDMADVITELERLIDNGYREIVLTGIHLGQFEDRHGNMLPDLIARAASLPGLWRLRLSSIEPQDITDAFIDIFSGSSVIMPHLHLPLQNGSDEILARMNRRYTVAQYRELVERLRTAKPDLLLSTDLIVGFPGETDAQFEESLNTVRQIGYTKVHVFPFSSRPGTRAHNLADKLPKQEIKKRAACAIEQTSYRAQEIKKSFIGSVMDVLAETTYNEQKAEYNGFTPNYLKVYFKSDTAPGNSIIPVKITDFDNELKGEIYL